MPSTGNSGLLSKVGLVLETNPGEQLLLAATTVASATSVTNNPSAVGMATTGGHVHYYVAGNTATGTITTTGTDPSGNSINEVSGTIPVAPQNLPGYTEYTTKKAFKTVTSVAYGGAGLTNGMITIYASQAAKFLAPIDCVAKEDLPPFSPKDHRGIAFKNIRIQQLDKFVKIDKFDGSLYPNSLWFPYTCVSNNPTITTSHTATSLKTATAVSGAPYTLTSQPSAPGQFLIFTTSGNLVSGSITITGAAVDNNGVAGGETITIPASDGTFYSTKRYSSIAASGITVSGMTAAATITITGVFSWDYAFTNDGQNINLYSAMLEWFNGTSGICLPYSIFADASLDWQKDKELMITAKGESQDFLTVGDVTATAMGTNPFTTLSQPGDLPMVGWPGTFYIDTLPSGTPFTTQFTDFLTFKIALSTAQKGYHTGDGAQRWSRATRDTGKPPSLDWDATVDFQNHLQYQNFKKNQALVFGAQFFGSFLGSLSAVNYYEYWQFTLPSRYVAYDVDPSKDKVEANVKGECVYSETLGYCYKLVVRTATPPTYTA